MIKKELHFVWITKDGRKFLNRNEAVEHEDTLADPKDLVTRWLERINN